MLIKLETLFVGCPFDVLLGVIYANMRHLRVHLNFVGLCDSVWYGVLEVNWSYLR